MWAIQTTFFGRIWRVYEGHEIVQATWHEEIKAHDIPRFLCWQLDGVVEDYLQRMEVLVLNQLKAATSAKAKHSKNSWFVVYLAAYIYLGTLEGDAWNLSSWKARSARWKLDPVLSNNPASSPTLLV